MNEQKIPRLFSVLSLTVKDVPTSNGAEQIFMRDSYKKNLKAGTYYFNAWHKDNSPYVRDFFGENISIQAIVGRNGSGKSTIIDLLIKTINNLAFCLYGNEPKDNALQEQFPLRYVRGLFVELRFTKEDVEGVIKCSDSYLEYQYGDEDYEWDVLDFRKKEHVLSKEEKIKIARTFFYSLVINYSIHSFNEEVYERDYCYGGETNYPWIKALFHKNDGYRIPLNLNPYRSEASINMIHENQLNDSRLQAILIASESNQQQFLEGYRLSSIDYYYNPDHLLGQFSINDLPPAVLSDDKLQDADMRRAAILKCFKAALKSRNSYAFRILEHYGYCYAGDEGGMEDDLRVYCYLYIVYKVLNIVATYPSYRLTMSKDSSLPEDWEKYIMRMAFAGEGTVMKGQIWEKMEEEKVLERLVQDNSHITLKIRQVRNFLKKYHPGPIVTDALTKDGPIDYKTYFAHLGVKYDLLSLDMLMSWLPPALFSPDILLDKYVQKDEENGGKSFTKQNDRPIPIRSLSSGELQYIHTLSTIVYHVNNLQSVNSPDRESYNCVNLMMDEIEMCFHPDYQRTLVNKLLFSITSLGLNKTCGFNIILATHSPFILSDIPKYNVLYLKDGECVNDEITFSPFAANVNDTLKQSFFLDNGFIGEFAKRKIKSLCDYLDGESSAKRLDNNEFEWTDETVERFIAEIGDPLMRESLYMAWAKKRFRKDSYGEYRWHKQRLKEIEGDSDNLN
jgi:hypothetical protein